MEAPHAHLGENLPRLRIHHFLLWITIAALQLTLPQFFIDYAEPLAAKPTLLEQLPTIFMSGILSVAICVGWWRFKSKIKPIQPGEWLACISAMESVASLFSALCSFAMQWFLLGTQLVELGNWMLLPSVLVDLVLSVLLCTLVLRADSWPWRIVYVVLVIVKTSFCVYLATIILNVWEETFTDIYALFSYIMLGALVVALFVSMCTDAIQRRQRRWTHWVGATLLMLLTSFYAIFSLLAFLTT